MSHTPDALPVALIELVEVIINVYNIDSSTCGNFIADGMN